MKKILALVLLLVGAKGFAQTEIKDLWITEDFTLHIIAPEDIEYVDISTNRIIGDIPVENVLRLKFQADEEIEEMKRTGKWDREVLGMATVTVVGQSFLTTYRINFSPNRHDFIDYKTQWEIEPSQMLAIAYPKVTMTKEEMKKNALDITKLKSRYNNVKVKKLGLNMFLNNIVTIGDYVFVDVTMKNHTNLKYDIDQYRFHIEDRKINKATNIQSLEIQPEFTLYNPKFFKKNHRNVFVFKKFTFPNNKILSIEVSEEQISGRTIKLKVDYSDLLNADSF